MSKRKIAVKGVVTPPKLKPIVFAGSSMTLDIVHVHPENGYDENDRPIKSDNFMALISYPDGVTKNHQFKSTSDLLVKVTDFLSRQFGFNDFKFERLPKEIKRGESIKVVKNGD